MNKEQLEKNLSDKIAQIQSLVADLAINARRVNYHRIAEQAGKAHDELESARNILYPKLSFEDRV